MNINGKVDSIRCFKCKWFPYRLHRAKCQKCYLEGCIIYVEEYFDTNISTEMNECQKDNQEIINTLSIDEKIKRIEQEIILIKEGYNDLVTKFENYIGKKKLGETPEELMDEENSNVIIHPIQICNKLGEIKAPQIECTIRIEDFLIKTYALLDTCCTHVIIDEKIIQKRFITLAEKPMIEQQVNGSFNRYTNHLSTTAKISFMTNCYSSPENFLPLKETWIKPLNLRHQVILGLSFLLKDNGQITFNKDFFTLSRHCMKSPLQKKLEIISPEELDKQIEYSKNQAINKKDYECEKEGQCSLANIIQEDFEEEEYEDMYLTELVHINNSINYFMINIKEEQIQSLIDKFKKLKIIGENVLKYWEKDKVECILKIKNPDYKIKTAKIEAIEKDREDYKTHINDLLKLGVIRRSYSPHRLTTFLVNKHSEQKRGKSMMVINYKRLNDNT